MGEARRRKQLDPAWGRANRQSSAENQHREIVALALSNPKTMVLSLVASTLMKGILTADATLVTLECAPIIQEINSDRDWIYDEYGEEGDVYIPPPVATR